MPFKCSTNHLLQEILQEASKLLLAVGICPLWVTNFSTGQRELTFIWRLLCIKQFCLPFLDILPVFIPKSATNWAVWVLLSGLCASWWYPEHPVLTHVCVCMCVYVCVCACACVCMCMISKAGVKKKQTNKQRTGVKIAARLFPLAEFPTATVISSVPGRTISSGAFTLRPFHLL